MYLDADVLAVQDINPLFEEVNEFRYSREFQPMSAPAFSDLLTDEEMGRAKWMRGVNSGIYVAPANYLPKCLDKWKAIIDLNPAAYCYDQTALNAAPKLVCASLPGRSERTVRLLSIAKAS